MLVDCYLQLKLFDQKSIYLSNSMPNLHDKAIWSYPIIKEEFF